MEDTGFTRSDLIQLIARLGIAALASYFTVKMAVMAMDPNATQKKAAKKKANEIFKKLGIKENKTMNEYELMIASQIVVPGQLSTAWQDIAGLNSVIDEIKETVIYPIRRKEMKSKLVKPPKGILLHGPPGCGKTLLARALAHEAGAHFINLDVSSLTDKWYGESQKLSSAVFSLAAKIEPCIIFIDEIDSFLRIRNSGDHEATAMMKAQFLQQWDGLSTDHSHCVVVMGATNRPQDVDKAILRRMPSNFHVPLPSEDQRLQILNLILRDENLHDDLDLSYFANRTEGFSGSDLQELCRKAAVCRLKYLSQNVRNEDETLNAITSDDFIKALYKTKLGSVENANSINRQIDLD